MKSWKKNQFLIENLEESLYMVSWLNGFHWVTKRTISVSFKFLFHPLHFPQTGVTFAAFIVNNSLLACVSLYLSASFCTKSYLPRVVRHLSQNPTDPWIYQPFQLHTFPFFSSSPCPNTVLAHSLLASCSVVHLRWQKRKPLHAQHHSNQSVRHNHLLVFDQRRAWHPQWCNVFGSPMLLYESRLLCFSPHRLACDDFKKHHAEAVNITLLVQLPSLIISTTQH